MDTSMNPEEKFSIAQERMDRMRNQAARERLAAAVREHEAPARARRAGSIRLTVGHVLIGMGRVVAGEAVR